jgi:hypothetical protein
MSVELIGRHVISAVHKQAMMEALDAYDDNGAFLEEEKVVPG